MIPRPRNPKLRLDGWMSLSRRIFEDDVMLKDGEAGRSAVGRSRNEDTAVEEALFLLQFDNYNETRLQWTLGYRL